MIAKLSLYQDQNYALGGNIFLSIALLIYLGKDLLSLQILNLAATSHEIVDI